jgi:hypothetical protein
MEIPDDGLKHSIASIIANLSGAPEKEEMLIQQGVLSLLQTLNSCVHRTDTMCYIVLW